MTRLDDLGEFGLIRRLVAAGGAGAPQDGIVIGPGDDAAVLRPEAGRDLVVTTDTFHADRHWRDAWIEPEALGTRLARANLSDLAAMAARPRWALASFGLARGRDAAWVETVQRGLAGALAADGARIVGGNVTEAGGGEWLALTLIGDVPPGLAWTRAGARPGDRLVATGYPGRAGAAVALLASREDAARDPKWRALVESWRTPRSRVDLARALEASGAVHAAIDLSDGLAGDLAHLVEASGVGAVLDARNWPDDPEIAAAAAALGLDAVALRIGASDDYELLLAVDPEGFERAASVAREAGVPWSTLGEITASPGTLELHTATGNRRLDAAGYDHFGGGPTARG